MTKKVNIKYVLRAINGLAENNLYRQSVLLNKDCNKKFIPPIFKSDFAKLAENRRPGYKLVNIIGKDKIDNQNDKFTMKCTLHNTEFETNWRYFRSDANDSIFCVVCAIASGKDLYTYYIADLILRNHKVHPYKLIYNEKDINKQITLDIKSDINKKNGIQYFKLSCLNCEKEYYEKKSLENKLYDVPINNHPNGTCEVCSRNKGGSKSSISPEELTLTFKEIYAKVEYQNPEILNEKITLYKIIFSDGYIKSNIKQATINKWKLKIQNNSFNIETIRKDIKEENSLVGKYNKFKIEAENQNCILISSFEEYKTKPEHDLEYKCNITHKKFKKDSTSLYHTILKIRTEHNLLLRVQKYGGKLIEGEKYNDPLDQIKFECKYGHKFPKTPAKVLFSGEWCPRCNTKLLRENIVRNIFENIFNEKFPNTIVPFLYYEKTGNNLTLDGYNEELKIAFEHQGDQHLKENKLFHGRNKIEARKNFEEGQLRDRFKIKRCTENGIKLVVINQIKLEQKDDEIFDSIEAVITKYGIEILKYQRNYDAITAAYRNTNIVEVYKGLLENQECTILDIQSPVRNGKKKVSAEDSIISASCKNSKHESFKKVVSTLRHNVKDKILFCPLCHMENKIKKRLEKNKEAWKSFRYVVKELGFKIIGDEHELLLNLKAKLECKTCNSQRNYNFNDFYNNATSGKLRNLVETDEKIKEPFYRKLFFEFKKDGKVSSPCGCHSRANDTKQEAIDLLASINNNREFDESRKGFILDENSSNFYKDQIILTKGDIVFNTTLNKLVYYEKKHGIYYESNISSPKRICNIQLIKEKNIQEYNNTISEINNTIKKINQHHKSICEVIFNPDESVIQNKNAYIISLILPNGKNVEASKSALSKYLKNGFQNRKYLIELCQKELKKYFKSGKVIDTSRINGLVECSCGYKEHNNFTVGLDEIKSKGRNLCYKCFPRLQPNQNTQFDFQAVAYLQNKKMIERLNKINKGTDNVFEPSYLGPLKKNKFSSRDLHVWMCSNHNCKVFAASLDNLMKSERDYYCPHCEKRDVNIDIPMHFTTLADKLKTAMGLKTWNVFESTEMIKKFLLKRSNQIPSKKTKD